MPQIKLTIPDDIYNIIKEKAKENFRPISHEINFRLKQSIKKEGPGVQSTPTQPILYYPPGVRSPIPETPYKITSEQQPIQSQSLTLDQLQQQGIAQVKFNKPQQEKELSPIEEQIKLNKLKDQRYKWIEKTIDRLYPEYRDFPNYDEFLSANQKMYWDKPDEEFIKHIEEVKKEYEEDEENSSFDFEDTTPHSPEYLKIKNYFSEHCAPYSFEDVVAHVNNGDTKYIKNYYDIDLHDALGSPHTYDFSDEQWEEIFKILSE